MASIVIRPKLIRTKPTALGELTDAQDRAAEQRADEALAALSDAQRWAAEQRADAAVAALTNAQHRAVELRVAAEKLAEDARLLEEHLAADARKARHAADNAQALRLQQVAEQASISEAEAAGHAEACAVRQKLKANDRTAAEVENRACQIARDNAASEVAKAEAVLAEARRKLEGAKAATVKAAERQNKAISTADVARLEASESTQLLFDRRTAREYWEQELRAIQERIKGFDGEVPSLATIDQLDELDARREQSARPRGE